jgi:hypothetical protein
MYLSSGLLQELPGFSIRLKNGLRAKKRFACPKRVSVKVALYQINSGAVKL